MGGFGRKTGGGRKLFAIFFRCFSIFRAFFRHKLLPFRDKRRDDHPQKNHTKKPTVGFWCFGAYGMIFSVRMKKDMKVFEGEAVARPRDYYYASMKKGLKFWNETAPLFSEKAPTTMPNVGCSRPVWRRSWPDGLMGVDSRASLAFSTSSSRKSLIFRLDLRKSLIFKPGLTQVVDFHDFSRFFQIVAAISHAFLQMGKTCLAVGPWRGLWAIRDIAEGKLAL
jgi:hypothetical protein